MSHTPPISRMFRLIATATVVASPCMRTAVGQETLRASVDSSGAQGNDSSFGSSLSADGRLLAFFSQATNLAAGDTNGFLDAFVRDLATGITERVSLDSSGIEGNGDSFSPVFSADGQVVLFGSMATNLVSGDTNGTPDLFVRDLAAATTERVTVDSAGVQGNGGIGSWWISVDGRFVSFSSDSNNLVSGDTNARIDIFVRDRLNGTTERVSVDSSGVQCNDTCDFNSISADGRIVAFSSYATNLVPGDTNATNDVFVHDRATGITERVSVSSAGKQGNSYSEGPALSADGNLVAFASRASNLVSGDTNGVWDIFVRDRALGTTERVSVDSSGAEGNLDSFLAAITPDGRFVAYYGDASNLVSGDTNRAWDIFVHDRILGLTERVSVDSAGAQANSDSYWPALSANGEEVSFVSYASNLVSGDTNAALDVFVRKRCDGTWSEYGNGYPGSNGVPTFVAAGDPVLGTTLTLDLDNSYGSATVGLLFIGFQRAELLTSWGGKLLVEPTVTVWLPLPAGTTTLSSSLPNDPSLCELTIDLQVFEADPGAAKGVSFTRGLELILGH